MEAITSSSQVFRICLLFSTFLLLSPSSASVLCNLSDRNALLQIAKDLSITDWDPNTTPDCCSIWFGVGCNTDGRVTSLSYNLDGTTVQVSQRLPASIGGLPFLETLNLFGNLTGTIPDSIVNLTGLQSLQLAAGLTGSIPYSIGRLKRLTYLDLSSNSFTGSIPPTLGRLTSLSYLDLSGNSLSGAIPASLGRLTGLDRLGLSSNQLTGPIPASLSRLTKIGRFDLRANQLSGPIPASFGAFNNPKMLLFLAGNRLSGPVPRSLGEAKVNFLELSSNRLTGDASFLFGRNKTWLETLDIGSNRFKFDISNVEFPLGLRTLFIENNEIYGSLPKQLGQLPLEIRGLYVSNNRLCGRIPTGRRLKLMSPDAFANNTCLCGIPLPPCK